MEGEFGRQAFLKIKDLLLYFIEKIRKIKCFFYFCQIDFKNFEISILKKNFFLFYYKKMLQIYKASAGSGKTHTLTQEYLKLSFKYPDKFSRIIAVTFTNKAAEEMKVRIIEEINNLISKGKKSAHYKIIKETYPEFSEAQIVNQASKIRDRILHNYSNFAISTIDSFVQRIVRSFAYEIKVPAGYKIEMDSQKVIEDITEMLFNKISDNKQLQKWLTQFALYKIEQGTNWDFREDVKKLAYEIFKEKFQSFKTTTEDVDLEEEKNNLNNLLKEIIEIKKDFEAKMKEVSVKTNKILSENGILRDKLGRNFKTITNYLTVKITEKQEFEPGKTVLKALESEENWFAKSAKSNIKEQVMSVYSQLSELLDYTINLYQEEFSSYLTAKKVLSNFHSFGILNDISNILPEYREANNLLLISDTTVFLKKIISGNNAPFIYEKIGTKFQNILIDEFQDTSGFQWFNFKPLIENSLGSGFFNLIVGDIKQSIYRWRGGDWRLLLTEVKKDIGENFIRETSLDTNWRSKKNIIDFNNSVFKQLPEVAQNFYNKDFSTNNSSIKNEYDSVLTSAYLDTYQKVAPINGKEGGRVKINFIKVKKSEKGKKWRENIRILIPETIDTLLKEQNYRPGDITILVRTNKEGKEIVDLLLDYINNTPDAKNYDIISSDSLFINNSSSVKIIILALKYLHNKEDQVNLTNLIFEYQKIINDKKLDLHYIFDSKNKQDLFSFLPEEFIEKYDELQKIPLYELVENLISIFKLNNYEQEYPYLHSFQDSVLKYVRDEYSDLHNFLQFWDTKGNTISVNISDKQDAVNIMTIHKSKGLAFKVVLLPYLDWRLDHSPTISPIIWCKPDREPYNKFAFLPVKYNSQIADTHFNKDYFDEKLYAFMDAINMLYVAFTRPIEELIVMTPTDKESKELTYISDLLYNTIVNSDIDFKNDENNIISLNKYYNAENFICEIDVDYEKININKYKKQETEKSFSLDYYPVFDWRKNISVKSHAGEFFIESIKYVEDKVNYGNLMHEIFSKIIVKSDINDAIQDMIFAGKIDSKEKAVLIAKLKEIIAIPEVNDWFSDKWTVKNESEILTSTGEIKIPDRIIFGEDETIVIDFKFGEVRNEHQEQVLEYMKIISEISPDKKTRGFLLYGDKKIIKEVIKE